MTEPLEDRPHDAGDDGSTSGSDTEPVTLLDREDAERILRDGEVEVIGRLVDASNATLYCESTLDGVTITCVHKPVTGERPLWDFPNGTLAGREVATYV